MHTASRHHQSPLPLFAKGVGRDFTLGCDPGGHGGLVAGDEGLTRLLAALDDFEKESVEQLASWRHASGEAADWLRDVERAFRSEVEALQKTLAATIKADSLDDELFAPRLKAADTLPEVRRKGLYALLDRLIEERGLAKQVELQ